MAVTKEVELDKIEIIFVNGFPHVQSRGKIVIKEDGKKIADAGTFRFGAKSPDQDAGDQPDAPDPQGGKVAVPESIKQQLRAAQQAHVTQELAQRYRDRQASSRER